MNKFTNQLLFITILLLSSFSYADQLQAVKFVVDGDTIMLKNQKFVRYIGIDCPEINHKTGTAAPFGFEAKKANEKLVSEMTVRLEFDKQQKDHFGRMLAYVYNHDGTFINNELIKKGYAWSLFKRPNTKHDIVLLRSQRYAMSNRLGIWKLWHEKEGFKYIGNKKSKRFHLFDCQFGKKIAFANQIIYQKKWDAFYNGYSPCKKCLLK
jgi:micrococcal nuclease